MAVCACTPVVYVHVYDDYGIIIAIYSIVVILILWYVTKYLYVCVPIGCYGAVSCISIRS